MTTLAQAKAALRPLGVVLSKKDGEYKVNFRGGREGTAYYTDDINDAVATGRHMAAGGYPAHGNAKRTRGGLKRIRYVEITQIRAFGNSARLTWRGPAGGPYRGLVGSGPPHFTVERSWTKWRLLDANGDLMGTYSERDTAMRVASRVFAKYASEYGNRRRHGNAEIAPGKFYAYRGHKVWVDAVPGGFFAMINGTAIQARGKTPGEALKRLRERLDAGGPASANRKRSRGTRFGNSFTKAATYDVIRVSMYSPKRRHESGPHTWQVAWRKAAKLNDKARKDFREGRTMYDVPEYRVEKRA